MAFKVTEFLNNVNSQNGLSRSAHFEVNIALPPALGSKYNAKNIALTASSVNIPNVSIDAAAIRRSGTSYFEYFPTNVTYSNLYVFFYSDANAKNLSMLKDWIDLTFNIDMGNNTYDGNNFRVAYRNEYAAPTLTLDHFDANGKSIIKYTFYEVFLQSIFDVYLNWSSRDDIVNIPVMFKYKYYTHNNKISNPGSNLTESKPSTITKLPASGAVSLPPKTTAVIPDTFKPGGGRFGGGGASGGW